MAKNLHDKILQLYPDLKEADFYPGSGTIVLKNDGNGDYIESWSNHNPQPTQAQLDAAS